MFQKLQKRWGISATRVVLVLCTFAIGGSFSGWAARSLMPFLELDKGPFYWLVYVVLVTLIWPMSVLMFSIVFGQFAFFKAYLGRMAKRMGFGRSAVSSESSDKKAPKAKPKL